MTRVQLLLMSTLAACGSSNTGANLDAPVNGSADAPGLTPDAPAGSNMIMGTVGGKGFNAVMAMYWIGMPDANPLGPDTVIYMFDKPVACNQMTTAGWDTAAAIAGTQILEMKMVGTTLQAYPTTTAASHIPAKGESLSSYTVAAAGATDMIASGGSVTLSTIGTPVAGQFASGTFALMFGAGSLTGKYNAPYCANGREP